MTPKEILHVHIPMDKFKRMKKVMERERLSNKTAFVINAIELACEQQERVDHIDRLEKMVNILAENARIDREEEGKRHTEVMIWLDVMTQAILGGDKEDYADFLKIVKTETKARGI